MSLYELWGRRIKEAKGCVGRWMKGEKENTGTEVYDDLKIFTRHYLKPTVKLYNKLRRQESNREFIRNSDYTQLELKTEQLVMAYNKLVMEYEYEPRSSTDPDDTSTAMIDLSVLNNYQ